MPTLKSTPSPTLKPTPKPTNPTSSPTPKPTYMWEATFIILGATADDVQGYESIIESSAFAAAVSASLECTVTIDEVSGVVSQPRYM